MFWVGVMGIWVLTAAFTKWNGKVMMVAGRKRGLRKISGGSVGRPGTDGFSGASPHRAWPGTHPSGCPGGSQSPWANILAPSLLFQLLLG